MKRDYTLNRNNYFKDKLVSVMDLAHEQRYIKNKLSLLNTLLYGTGVIKGLDVRSRNNLVVISKGIAFDSLGRDIIVPEPVELTADDLDIDMSTPEYVNLFIMYREIGIEPINIKSEQEEYDANEDGQAIEMARHTREDTRNQFYTRRLKYNKFVETYKFFLSDKISGEIEDYSVYLARLNIIKKKGYLIINVLESASESKNELHKLDWDKSNKGTVHTETLMNNVQLTELLKNMETARDTAESAEYTIKEGLYEFEFNKKPLSGCKFFSDEIKHGLNTGFVNVRLAVECDNDHNAIAFSGDSAIFLETEYGYDMPDLETAVQLYLDRGTFRIGIKLNQDLDSNRLRVYWAATSSSDDKYAYNSKKVDLINRLQEAGNDLFVDNKKVNTVDLSVEQQKENKDFVKFNTEKTELQKNDMVEYNVVITEDASNLAQRNAAITENDYNIEENNTEIAEDYYDIEYNNTEIEEDENDMEDYETIEDEIAFVEDIVEEILEEDTEEYRGQSLNQLRIIPDTALLRVGEDMQLRAMLGDTEVDCNWMIVEDDGGEIDDDGFYVAPDLGGVFEINAVSVEDCNKRASAFIVVK